LIWKIWKTTKKSENNIGGNQLQFIARVLMESGFLYLAISIAHFIGWFSRDDFAINILGAMVSFSETSVLEKTTKRVFSMWVLVF
jgi:hypothetical protein